MCNVFCSVFKLSSQPTGVGEISHDGSVFQFTRCPLLYRTKLFKTRFELNPELAVDTAVNAHVDESHASVPARTCPQGSVDTSPAVARARRALNHLHPLVTSGSANNSVCFLRAPQLLLAMPKLHHSMAARRSMPAVRLLSFEACL